MAAEELRLSELSKEELNALKDEEVKPYVEQWLNYVQKVINKAGKGRAAAARVLSTLNQDKKELFYVLMFTIKPHYRPQVVKIFDGLAKLEEPQR